MTYLSCEEVQKMLDVKLASSVVIEAIEGMAISPDAYACIKSIPDVPPDLLAAIEAQVQAPSEPPAVAPMEETKVPQLEPQPVLSSHKEAYPCMEWLLIEAPDQGAAAVIGGITGFGAGHFYARQIGVGGAFFLLDTVLIGTLIASQVVEDPRAAVAISMVGSAGLFASHAVQAPAAALAAHRVRRETCVG